ncbi:hypothetical protein RI367_004944 [Sorochytrium milnesiophthora]
MDSPQPTVSAEEAFRLANGPLEGIYAAIDSMKALNVTVPVESAIVLLQVIITLRTTPGARPDARPPAPSRSNIPKPPVFDGEPGTRQDFVHAMELYLKLTGNPADTDEHNIDTIVAFFGKTPRAWFRGMAEDDPMVTCDYQNFLKAFNTYFGSYDPALKAKHAFNTMRQARGQATLEYIQAFKLATASLPHRVSEEDRVDRPRSSNPSDTYSNSPPSRRSSQRSNHAELLEDDVQYARRAEQQRTSAASSSSGIQPPGQPRGQPSASTQQPGNSRGQWVNASSSNPPRGNKWDNNRNPSTSRPDAGKQPERQASQPPRGPPRPADRPPNAMDVEDHQWNTSPAGGQPSLAELQDLPDHKLRQKYDIMTERCKFCHQPGHPIKHCPVLYAHDLRAAEHEHDHALLREAHHWTQHYPAFLRGLASCPKPFIAPFNLWNEDGWVRLEHHVADVNVSDVLEDDDFSDKPYHSSGSGHSSDTDGSYAPRIGNAGYLAATRVHANSYVAAQTPEVPRPDNAISWRQRRSPDRECL